jgi:hypothetical protein
MCTKGIPHPVSGYARRSLMLIVESPARKIRIFRGAGAGKIALRQEAISKMAMILI